MKNSTLITIVSVTCAMILVMFAFCPAYAEAKTYELIAVVTGYDVVEDIVIVVDENGDEWCFYGSEGFDIGDVVWMTMDDVDTPKDITDDEITDVEIGGFFTRQSLLWWLTR